MGNVILSANGDGKYVELENTLMRLRGKSQAFNREGKESERESETKRQTERQTDRETERQRDRERAQSTETEHRDRAQRQSAETEAESLREGGQGRGLVSFLTRDIDILYCTLLSPTLYTLSNSSCLSGDASVLGRGAIYHAGTDTCVRTPAGDSSAGARHAQVRRSGLFMLI